MTAPAQPANKQRRAILILALALLVGIGVVIAVFLDHGPTASGSPDSDAAGDAPLSVVVPTGGQVPPAPSATATSATATSVPAPTIPGTPVPTASAAPETEDGQKQLAAGGAAGFMKEAAATLAEAATPNVDELAAIAAGSAYEGILASAAEFEANGWRQEGEPVVVSTNVMAYDPVQSPDTMSLGVCVDSSKVNVLTESGTVVRAGAASDRSLNVLTMSRNEAGAWLVTQLSFPDNPNC